jgi:hypothetical protein
MKFGKSSIKGVLLGKELPQRVKRQFQDRVTTKSQNFSRNLLTGLSLSIDPKEI